MVSSQSFFFFIDKQQHQVKTDQTLTIKFDNGFDDKEVMDNFGRTPPLK